MKRIDTKEAFESALDRLIMGLPNHPDLKAEAERGRLRISIATVAKEAGRSRTLIGLDECAYPEIRERILKAIKEGPENGFRRQEAKKLVARNADLARRLVVAESIQAAVVLELGIARKAVAEAKPHIVRKR